MLQMVGSTTSAREKSVERLSWVLSLVKGVSFFQIMHGWEFARQKRRRRFHSICEACSEPLGYR